MYSSHNFFNAHFVGNRWGNPYVGATTSIKIDTDSILSARSHTSSPHKRRSTVERWTITSKSMGSMNGLIEQFNPTYRPLDKDDMVTMARWTINDPQQAQQFIANKKSIYQFIKWIAGNNYWPASMSTREASEQLTTYFYFGDQPIPDTIPLVGLIDNAIVINEVEDMFAQDIQAVGDFMNYCFSHQSHPNLPLVRQWEQAKHTQMEHMKRPDTFVADYATPNWIKPG